MTDAINPDYYSSNSFGIKGEAIDYARQMGFALGNAFKYVWRAGSKGDATEDLRKALWYVTDAGLNGSPLRGQIPLVTDAGVPMTRRRYVLGCIARGDLAKASDLIRALADDPEHIDKELQ